ncbi:MAG: hypothetical protein KBB52_07855 [Candidatus Omnitrophica bacterium]|nr:hypothetical protein [Candidatus Omnitrophota bacterium]
MKFLKKIRIPSWVILITVILSISVIIDLYGREIKVKGYTKKDGTYVRPHTRRIGESTGSSNNASSRSSYNTKSFFSSGSSYPSYSSTLSSDKTESTSIFGSGSRKGSATIKLKSGKSITGDIIEKNEDGIWVEIGGRDSTGFKAFFKNDEIQNLDSEPIGEIVTSPPIGGNNERATSESNMK